LETHTMSVFDDSRDSHPLLQDATVMGMALFGVA
jgi:hypothetical protein